MLPWAICPELNVSRQARPPTHIALDGDTMGHTAPQLPQFIGSATSSTHVPLQIV
jgi:hypothetical protein